MPEAFALAGGLPRGRFAGAASPGPAFGVSVGRFLRAASPFASPSFDDADFGGLPGGLPLGFGGFASEAVGFGAFSFGGFGGFGADFCRTDSALASTAHGAAASAWPSDCAGAELATSPLELAISAVEIATSPAAHVI